MAFSLLLILLVSVSYYDPVVKDPLGRTWSRVRS
jgi:hypothetical protein